MKEDPPSVRIKIAWGPEAKAQLRAIDQQEALAILHCLDRYVSHRAGDVKKLKVPLAGFRLRCGDYRLFFDSVDDDAITITGVKHRREAYR
jgi:mRNA-degrading endonuclease RelE of RelBE toxin-antitoxin system